VRSFGVVLVAATVALGAGATATAEPADNASLRLLSLQPLTLKGQQFARRERVRVDVYGPARLTRRVVATRAGRFTLRFDGVTATRCDLVRAIAVGGQGSRAGVKILPAPACLAE
jgi:hypothetical protein